jgi:hypothetical protein
MDKNNYSLNWFEIPVADFERARHFYQVIFSVHLDEFNLVQMKLAMFPPLPHSKKPTGALVQSKYHHPSSDGPLIYLNSDPDLSQVLEKVEEMGGKVLVPKTMVSPDLGYMAFIADTEGNRIAIHSNT